MLFQHFRTIRPVSNMILLVIALVIAACAPAETTPEAAADKEEAGEVKWGHVKLVEGPMDGILVKDYKPRPSLVVPENHVPRASMPVIDVHTHVYAETPEEIREWVETMDLVGIETTVILTGATGDRFDRLVGLFLDEWPGRFQLYCGLLTDGIEEPEYPQKAAAELERCYQSGARGVGELVDKGWGFGSNEENQLPREKRLHPNDSRLDLFWEKCAELNMPVNLHVADHPSCWQPLGPEWERTPDFQVFNLHGKDVPDYEELMTMRDDLLKKHRDTRFILCHFSNLGNNLGRLSADMDNNPNMYLDISARDYEIGRQPRNARAFLAKYRSRIMFGTDMGRDREMYEGWWRLLETADEFIPGRLWWRMYGLDLDPELLSDLYRNTAKKTLNWD